LGKHSEKCTRFEPSEQNLKNDLGLLFCDRRMRTYSENKLRERMSRPLRVSLKMYSPGKVFHAIRHAAGSIMLESGASLLNVHK
jgi:hypothetical protein